MAPEKLVVLSDIWGAKKGLWITSYLGYLQQYFEIEYYDIQQLANIDSHLHTEKQLHTAFIDRGIDAAVSHLLKREKEPAHYLAFSMGGTIAWKANLKGLPMKSLSAVSATRLRKEVECIDCPADLFYGGKDLYKPSQKWLNKIGVKYQVFEKFGHEMYSDEKVIQKVSMDMLNKVTKKQELKSNAEVSVVLAKKIS